MYGMGKFLKNKVIIVGHWGLCFCTAIIFQAAFRSDPISAIAAIIDIFSQGLITSPWYKYFPVHNTGGPKSPWQTLKFDEKYEIDNNYLTFVESYSTILKVFLIIWKCSMQALFCHKTSFSLSLSVSWIFGSMESWNSWTAIVIRLFDCVTLEIRLW